MKEEWLLPWNQNSMYSFNIKIIGVASKPDSTLIKASDIKILIPNVKEADPTGMVPTSSTSITLLLGDNSQYYWGIIARNSDRFIVGSNDNM